jgi:hypothetical protein
MIAGIMWDWVWTGVAIYISIAAIPLALLTLIGLVYAACLGVAYFIDWVEGRR